MSLILLLNIASHADRWFFDCYIKQQQKFYMQKHFLFKFILVLILLNDNWSLSLSAPSYSSKETTIQTIFLCVIKINLLNTNILEIVVTRFSKWYPISYRKIRFNAYATVILRLCFTSSLPILSFFAWFTFLLIFIIWIYVGFIWAFFHFPTHKTQIKIVFHFWQHLFDQNLFTNNHNFSFSLFFSFFPSCESSPIQFTRTRNLNPFIANFCGKTNNKHTQTNLHTYIHIHTYTHNCGIWSNHQNHIEPVLIVRFAFIECPVAVIKAK